MKKTSFRMISSIIVVLLFVLCSGQSASAGFKEGVEAYKRGDYATALKEFHPLANRGNAPAQFNLGVMYDNGQGVPQDYREASKWYRKAANQRNAFAQNNLGFKYSKGHGVSQDYVSEHMWFNISGASGNKDAIKNRVMVEKTMFHWQVEKAQRLARGWKPKKNKITP